MLNKIIISALIVMSVSVNAQDLPPEAYLDGTVSKHDFTSGKVYNFRNITEMNADAIEMYAKGRELYYAGKYKKASEYFVEFINSEIYGINIKWNGYPYNPYRVDKYNACQYLKDIYSRLGNYKRAYYYYNKGAKKYWYGYKRKTITGNEPEKASEK
jgi:hypothetical protein